MYGMLRLRLSQLVKRAENPLFEGSPWTARILVVEDNADIAEMMAMLLGRCGHRVLTAPDGVAGLAAAQAHLPEVLLIDIGLPKMDGYELARRVRADPGLQRALLVAITAYGSEQDRLRAFSAGFDAHMVKPVPFEALHKELARMVRSRTGPKHLDPK
jgi:CheY-like chemotaxis protein